MGRSSRQAEDLLQLLARRLDASLASGRVMSSALDQCLVEAGADSAGRVRALQALHDAGIEVVPDGPIAAPASEDDALSPPVPESTSETPLVDPEDAGRARLELDRLLPTPAPRQEASDGRRGSRAHAARPTRRSTARPGWFRGADRGGS